MIRSIKLFTNNDFNNLLLLWLFLNNCDIII